MAHFPGVQLLVSNMQLQPKMHVRFERLYQFITGAINLTEREQSHLTRCSFCILWLDACADEKDSRLANRSKRDASLGRSPEIH